MSPQRTLPPALPPKSPRAIPVPQRRAISGPPGTTGGDQLQTKLRRLLNTDSKENVFFPDNSANVLQSGNVSIARDHSFDKFRYSTGSPSTVCRDDDRPVVGAIFQIQYSPIYFPIKRSVFYFFRVFCNVLKVFRFFICCNSPTCGRTKLFSWEKVSH